MPKSSNQKLKQMYLLRILMEQSDEKHPISASGLIRELGRYDVHAERKSIYSDIEELIHFGIDIECNKGRTGGGYYIASREFELPELKLLVDTVQSSKFITHKKSNELIKKIEGLGSKYDALSLQREVFVTNRVKTVNESIYYNVDCIHQAINENRQISFQYYEWSMNKEMKLKKEGELYHLSPFALCFDDENYYLIGYDQDADKIKHYRVDKMLKIKISEKMREGKAIFQGFDMASYTRKTFGMFGGTEEDVSLEISNVFIGVMIDRFGTDIPIQKIDDNRFKTRIRVQVSDQFFGWITGLGVNVRIISPQSVREQYLNFLGGVMEWYKE